MKVEVVHLKIYFKNVCHLHNRNCNLLEMTDFAKISLRTFLEFRLYKRELEAYKYCPNCP